jgi:hypothetical protein
VALAAIGLLAAGVTAAIYQSRLLRDLSSFPVQLLLLGKEMSLRARQSSAVQLNINLLRIEGD